MNRYSVYRENVRRDKARYGECGHISLYLRNSGYKISVNYRRCKMLEGVPFLKPLHLLQRLKYNRLCTKYGCEIPSHSTIGAGLKIDHPVGIVINSLAVIGENCTIKSGVVVGKTAKGVPAVGNNVLLGIHAMLLGGIVVGDDSQIGAGAIVVKDVAVGQTVVCEPAHVLHR